MLEFMLSALLTAPAPAPVETPAFTPTNALTTLLSVESFLFAVLNVAISASLPTATGLRVIARPRVFAFAAVSLVGVVAVGAGAAWWSLFIHHWPDGIAQSIAVTVLGIAIVAEPVFIGLIARGVPTS
jgi:hypothetical protein